MRNLALTLLGAALLVACGGGGQSSPGQPAPEPAAVSIVDSAFQPATLSVNVGQEVSWTNGGSLPHTVTFEGGPDSGTLQGGATFEHTFTAEGEFNYVCVIHPGMQGTVSVGP